MRGEAPVDLIGDEREEWASYFAKNGQRRVKRIVSLLFIFIELALPEARPLSSDQAESC